jgi:hypothetical protein|tara:strand:+ start:533 stop:1327 length:795 start_codon:yes stop_codon:yes gene_type:complete
MISINPFSEIGAFIPSVMMQIYVVAMFLLVIGATIFDVIHKKSAKYFFNNSVKAKKSATRNVNSGEKASLAFKTATNEVLTSSEFCSTRRRLAHLLTMYGFVLFVIATAVMIFSYSTPNSVTPSIWPLLWHLGAAMLCLGGYWFWFFIRVDVAAEGNKWYRVMRADLFVLSLIAMATFALIWSYLLANQVAVWQTLFFVLFIISSTVLFGGVLWSKFAHMFYKPAAAYQKRVTKADGSRENLPEPADLPEKFGLGIKREAPRHY